jgi:hypothetical protein
LKIEAKNIDENDFKIKFKAPISAEFPKSNVKMSFFHFHSSSSELGTTRVNYSPTQSPHFELTKSEARTQNFKRSYTMKIHQQFAYFTMLSLKKKDVQKQLLKV